MSRFIASKLVACYTNHYNAKPEHPPLCHAKISLLTTSETCTTLYSDIKGSCFPYFLRCKRPIYFETKRYGQILLGYVQCKALVTLVESTLQLLGNGDLSTKEGETFEDFHVLHTLVICNCNSSTPCHFSERGLKWKLVIYTWCSLFFSVNCDDMSW